MADKLKEAMKSMEGVGKKEQVKLASFLETAHVKSAQTMDKILHSKDGFVATAEKMKQSLSEHGKKMIDEIASLMQESAGKNAKDTRDILVKMRAVGKTLEQAGGSEAKNIKELMETGLSELEKRGSRKAIMGDLVKGKFSGMKDKMIRGVPVVGGLMGDYFQEKKRRNLLIAEQQEKIGKFVGDDKSLKTVEENTSVSAAHDNQETNSVLGKIVGANEDGTSKFVP
ncbi:TPA: hypothetical protein HA278_05520, partial [Candidatus Woesearchaeota archaeon]|nr:hypothetical protein [Candidatus Woesearchaeota archaeon]